MKNKLIKFPSFLLILFLTNFIITYSWAYPSGEYNGVDLLKDCKAAIKAGDNNQEVSSIELANANECVGYVIGILDSEAFYSSTLTLLKDKNVKQATFYCIPDDVTVNQSIRVIVNYLENHPEKLNLSSLYVSVMALKTAFPCN